MIEIARDAGVVLTSEVELFLDSCCASVVGVTGSNGKSTTAAMTAAILEAEGRRTWLGGNIGRSLLGELGRIQAEDVVVLELSSFQLFHLSADARFPEVAVVTNCRANHLDWHRDLEHYTRAKQRLIAEQAQDGVAVLNSTAPELDSWPALCRGQVLREFADHEIPPLQSAGQHNRANAACAAAAATALGCTSGAVERGLRNYAGLPHRMQFVAELSGRRFYDDSAATTPESTIAALRGLDEPVWLMAGGASKGGDFGALANAITKLARGAAFYGRCRHELRDRVADCAATPFASQTVEHLDDAAEWCFRRSRAGEAIVLSPGCSSLDQFRDFRERGLRFVEAVSALCERVPAA